MAIRDRTVHNPVRIEGVSGFVCPSDSQNFYRSITRLMTAPLQKVFRLERDGNVLIVTPQGDASGFRYNDVHHESNTTLQLLDDPLLLNVVVDFKSEHILGSIIVSVIIKVCRKAGAKGGKAAFCNASPDMLEVLTTMNLTKLWPYFPSRSEAINAVRGA